ncbi:MAG: endopeptidase La [Gammaproteobacteria bacterium]|nr:endopeptidase La [Gammaproteobacteria bacterium]
MTQNETILPILPLRDVVIYPHMVIPLFVGRDKSIKALRASMDGAKHVFLVAQKDASLEKPGPTDFYAIGTIATILQLLELPDGTIKVLVEGNARGELNELILNDDFFAASVKPLTDDNTFKARDGEALARALIAQFSQYVKLNKKIPAEILNTLSGIEDYGRLADTIAAHMPLSLESKQEILGEIRTAERIRLLLGILDGEIELLQMEKKIQTRVKGQMEKSQREYYLNEKMKAIQKELGDLDNGAGGSEQDKLLAKIEKAGMPAEVKEKAMAELNKLKMMPSMSAEATVSRNYLDYLLAVPWKEKSKVSTNLVKAQEILDKDHYGLEKVKERIIEFLAVQTRVKKIKGPILCLVGPPGVGKTSLGQSIANATGRKFVRMSLGGVRDEAEIRGHRRTYIGSMPGRIIQKLTKVKVKNPLFMLDEVDKMAMDFRGDPSSALLEVLDPEQNFSFADHYLEVDYDLSDVMFIATANSLNIPGPLLDRMEVIRIPGYTEDEKLNIALRYLIPKQIQESGLKEEEISIQPAVIREIVRYYTREAGVRNLEREISKICRKVVKAVLLKPAKKHVVITPSNLEKYLGVRKFRYGIAEENDQIGQVTGLAWTEVGGELLKIEASIIPGKGKSSYTGRLGDVMQESIQAAVTVVRSRCKTLGIPVDFYQTKDIHIHVPEGATPKDGPSAGIGMCTALVSALTGIPVKSGVAMTGEITLRGEVLPIGGLKEKLLAALRGGIKTVIIPEENKKDLKEMPKNITEHLHIHHVRWIDQVLSIALQREPQPLVEEDEIKESDSPPVISNAKRKRKQSGEDGKQVAH